MFFTAIKREERDRYVRSMQPADHVETLSRHTYILLVMHQSAILRARLL